MFLENGSKVLEKLVASCNGKPVPLRTFSAQELCLATNKYNNHYCFFWYKGSLKGQIVLVRKLPESKFWFDFAINDIVINAQMSAHSNVLKFVGCCLQTPCPNLEYEFATNGFLMDQIYVSRVSELQHQPMVWGAG